MIVHVTDSVGMEHEAEAQLMGLCENGHDCYVVIVPFIVDPAVEPEFRIEDFSNDAHVQVIGLAFDGTPAMVHHHRKPHNWLYAGLLIVRALSILFVFLNLLAGSWEFALLSLCTVLIAEVALRIGRKFGLFGN